MPSDPTARTHPWLAFAGVAGAWLLFALSDVAIDLAGAAARGKMFDPINTAIWGIGWVLWIGGTYAVRALAWRFPVERPALGRRLGLHLLLSTLVALVVITIEYAIIYVLEKTWPETVLIYPAWVYYTTKVHLYFLVYWLILGVCGAYDYATRLQQTQLTASQLQTQLAQAQVQALQMQIHPHFLFNTHHSIVSLMLNKDTAGAIKMLTRLSDLLRVTLKKSDQATSSLGEELQILDLYLGIQRERYRERLQVAIDVRPETLEAEVPCLLLQPIVENALQHGIDPQSSGGRLSIAAARRDDELVLVVRDNGPGLPDGFDLESQAGLGLRNTRARLERHYGDRQRLTIGPATGGGTELRLEFPFRPFAPAGSGAATGGRTPPPR